MRLFGFDLTLKRVQFTTPVYSVGTGGGGWTTWSGGERNQFDFQRDIHIDPSAVEANWAIFACKTLIAGDVGKMRIKLMQEDTDGLSEETDSPAFSPVLRKPNAFQTRQKLIESWIFSKLGNGNAYILKERDQRGVVTGLYVLDPHRVTLMVAQSGDIYYRLATDYLSQIPDAEVVVPAEEIIHDRMWCLFHPLVGISPLFASGLAATQGLKIQANSARFFENMSRPSGLLTTPTELPDTLARQYKANWEENYGSGNRGRTAVLGNGLKYEAITQNATDSQLVEQLKMSAEMICSTFHVPAYKVGVGPIPANENAETLNQIYYDTCLQPLIESIEAHLDEGLGLGEGTTKSLSTEFDLDALIRMDQSAQTTVLAEQVKAGITSPNEARAKLNMKAVPGGESPYLQQQNFPLVDLKKRSELANPFIVDKPTTNPTPSASGPASTADPAVDPAAGKAYAAEVRKLLELA